MITANTILKNSKENKRVIKLKGKRYQQINDKTIPDRGFKSILKYFGFYSKLQKHAGKDYNSFSRKKQVFIDRIGRKVNITHIYEVNINSNLDDIIRRAKKLWSDVQYVGIVYIL